MKLSSAYILEQLKKEYRVQDQNKISGEDGFFRPHFLSGHEKESAGHIKICSAKQPLPGKDGSRMFCGFSAEVEKAYFCTIYSDHRFRYEKCNFFGSKRPEQYSAYV